MSKLGILKVTALSLVLAAATPAFAAGFRGDAMYVGSGGSRVAQTSAGPVVSSADAAYCRSLGAYYDSTSREYMDGTGLWSPCP
jgi:hypothetical protein